MPCGKVVPAGAGAGSVFENDALLSTQLLLLAGACEETDPVTGPTPVPAQLATHNPDEVPPPDPPQVQLYWPFADVTAEGEPVKHSAAPLGAMLKLEPTAVPQAPFTAAVHCA